jgi:hypothetical protein
MPSPRGVGIPKEHFFAHTLLHKVIGACLLVGSLIARLYRTIHWHVVLGRDVVAGSGMTEESGCRSRVVVF